MQHWRPIMLNFILFFLIVTFMTSQAYTGSMSKATERPSVLYPAYVEQLPSLSGKTVAITGASRGLGYVTALTCAKKGAKVIMLSRKSDIADKAINAIKEASTASGAPSPIFVDCNLLDFSSVRRAAISVKECVGLDGLDVLCNNAGVMLQEDLASNDGYDITISTNVLSHFLLTKELISELETAARTKGEAKIVNMSSGSGFGPPAFNPVYFTKRGGNLGGARASYERYHQSKLANLCFTSALNDKFRSKRSNIKALACTPGVCSTDMYVHAQTILSSSTSRRDQVPSTEDGSLAQLKCIADPSAQSGDLWGPNGIGGLPEKVEISPPSILVNDEVKDELWRLCEDAVGDFDL